jgi:hypothetical protein
VTITHEILLSNLFLTIHSLFFKHKKKRVRKKEKKYILFSKIKKIRCRLFSKSDCSSKSISILDMVMEAFVRRRKKWNYSLEFEENFKRWNIYECSYSFCLPQDMLYIFR